MAVSINSMYSYCTKIDLEHFDEKFGDIVIEAGIIVTKGCLDADSDWDHYGGYDLESLDFYQSGVKVPAHAISISFIHLDKLIKEKLRGIDCENSFYDSEGF